MKKIRARTRKVLQDGAGDSVLAGGNGRREVCGSRKKFSGSEERTATNEISCDRRPDEVQISVASVWYADFLTEKQKSDSIGSR